MIRPLPSSRQARSGSKGAEEWGPGALRGRRWGSWIAKVDKSLSTMCSERWRCLWIVISGYEGGAAADHGRRGRTPAKMPEGLDSQENRSTATRCGAADETLKHGHWTGWWRRRRRWWRLCTRSGAAAGFTSRSPPVRGRGLPAASRVPLSLASRPWSTCRL